MVRNNNFLFVPQKYVADHIAEKNKRSVNTKNRKYIYYIENGFIKDDYEYAEYLYERRNGLC